METKDIQEALNKLEGKRPEIKAALENLMKAKEQLEKLYEKEYVKEVTIEGVPAKITAYKRASFEIQFRTIDERNAAIEKLLK